MVKLEKLPPHRPRTRRNRSHRTPGSSSLDQDLPNPQSIFAKLLMAKLAKAAKNTRNFRNLPLRSVAQIRTYIDEFRKKFTSDFQVAAKVIRLARDSEAVCKFIRVRRPSYHRRHADGRGRDAAAGSGRAAFCDRALFLRRVSTIASVLCTP